MDASETALPPDLVAGYRRFRATGYASERARWRTLGEEGQQPATMVIACSDSRSGPETVFDAGPGELFVVRNVAGLVPAYAPDTASHGASAALEFAVLALEVRSIVVLGHGHCGGISAALRGEPTLTGTDFLGAWVGGLRGIAADLEASGPMAPEDAQRALEHRSVERSIAHLRTFPWIASREAAGALSLSGAWFDIGLGELHALTAAGWTRLSDA
jgi:carbonic anhydrase